MIFCPARSSQANSARQGIQRLPCRGTDKSVHGAAMMGVHDGRPTNADGPSSPDLQIMRTILVENLTDNELLFALNWNKLIYYFCFQYQNKVKVIPFE